MSGPLVSVIVPTRNSAAALEPCLSSIRQQRYPSIELIVVDNHSTDATLDIARAATGHVIIRGPERSAQRNAGAKVAQGDYLVFIDSDMILGPTVVERCVEVLRADRTATGVIIPERSYGDGFWSLCKALERSCYVGDDTIEAARFFPRAVFEHLGGYDEALTGPEDWEFSRRAAALGHLVHIDAYVTHLEGHLTLRETMHSKFYYGKTMGRYARQQPAGAVRQLQLVRPAFVRHWRRLLAQPKLTAGMAFMKSCEFAAGGAGVAAGTWHTMRKRAS